MSPIQSFDQTLFQFINRDLSNSFFDILFPAITDLHKTIGFKLVFVPLLLVGLLYLYRMRGLFIIIGLAFSLSLADKIGSMGKNFWHRARPFQNIELDVIQRSGAGHFSFPSNHAANMFCMAFFLLYFFPKQKWIFFTIAILVSFSRIYNGVHYPIDVLAGGALGSFIGILGAEVTKQIIAKYEHSKQKKKNHG